MTAWEALLAFWLTLPPAVPYSPPLPHWSGRVIETQDWHLGIRPSSDDVGSAAISVQCTAAALSL